MAEYNLGRVAFFDKGAYSPEDTYNKWDFVTTVDSTYLFIGTTPQIGKPVTDTNFWKCIANGKPATLAAAAADLAKEAANSAATLANDKAALVQSAATLANDKATLAQTAADNANTKAGLANDAAVLATEKAALADSKATLANDKAVLAQSAADNANAKAAEVTSAVLSAGQLGPIKPTDAAPTPARNGNYTFSIGGAKPAWLTAEAGVTEVKAGDGVAVVYTAPSSYSYTHINVSSEIARLTDVESIILSHNYINASIGKNKFDKSITIQGSLINQIGEIQALSGWAYVDIPVLPNTTYSFKNLNGEYSYFAIGMQSYLNSEKTLLSFIDAASLTNAGGLGGKTFTTPNNCYFVRRTVKTPTVDFTESLQLELGSSTTVYEKYQGVIPESTIPITIARLTDIPEPIDLSQYVATNIGKNKYDGSDILNNTYVGFSGESSPYSYTGLSTDSGWKVAYQKVLPNTQYTMSGLGNSSQKKLIYCDLSKIVIGTTCINTNATFTTPSNCYYIAFTIKTSGDSDDSIYSKLQVELGAIATYYEAFNLIGGYLPESSVQPFINHNIAVMGDSITAMADSQNWFYYVRQNISFKTYVNLARSGATWMNWSDTVYDIITNVGSLDKSNVMWNQFNRLKAGITAGTMVVPDVIIIAAGTNDAWYRSEMFGSVATAFASNATIKDNNVNTITDTCISIRYLVELMRVEWPSAQIILCTPSQTYSSFWNNLKTCSGLIKDCSYLLGVDVIDCFNEAPFSYYTQTNYTDLKYDGTHPSILGAKYFGKYMTAKLSARIRPVIV